MNSKTDRKMVASGVDWIGEIPEGWSVARLGEHASLKAGVAVAAEDLIPEGIPVYGSNGIRGFYNQWLYDGNYWIIGRQGTAGSVNHASGKFWPAEHALVVKHAKKVNHAYLGYALMAANLPQYIGGTAQPGLAASFIERIALPHPNLFLQQSIANYLDHHVGLIDEERKLISKKIELLKEKRSALIFEVVTGKRTLVEAQHLAGVDDWSDTMGSGPVVAVPNPRADDPFMKSGRLVDSGVEWIGEMPEGWSVARLGEHASLKAGVAVAAEALKPEGFPVYGSNGIRGFYNQWLYDGNYWIIGRQGSAGSVNHASGKFWPAEHALVVKHTDRVNHAYLGYALMAANLPQYIGGTAQPGLAASFIERIALPHPNLLSQQAIADLLDYETGLIDKEIELLTVKNELLSDKRKALIFEAVTGKSEING